ncbi:hypothetical protein KA529_03370 [Candidatus Saccharibacteria bacterium]|nr:hypothetical protein [Candidatus Saccharibacteria bacterium]
MSDTSNTEENKVTGDEDEPIYTWFSDGANTGDFDGLLGDLEGDLARIIDQVLNGRPIRPYLAALEGSSTPVIIASSEDDALAFGFAHHVMAHTQLPFESELGFRVRHARTCHGHNPPAYLII